LVSNPKQGTGCLNPYFTGHGFVPEQGKPKKSCFIAEDSSPSSNTHENNLI